MFNRILRLSLIIQLLILSQESLALDIFGRDRLNNGSGSSEGLVLLYKFGNTRSNGAIVPPNIVADDSGVGTPLDLTITDTSRIQRDCGEFAIDPITGIVQPLCSLDFSIEGAVARSTAAATKVSSACQASNEVTIELWLKNDRDDDPRIRNLMTPLKIVSMGRGTGTTESVNGTTSYRGSSNDSNFFIGYTYNDAAQFIGSVRSGARQTRAALQTDGLVEFGRYGLETGHTQATSGDTPATKILQKEVYQHVVFTRNTRGDSKLYVSTGSPSPFGSIPILRSTAPGPATAQNFSGWGTDFLLSLGNESTFADGNAPRISNNSGNRSESRNWRGQIYLLAVYCKAHTDQDILGVAAPGANYAVIPPNPNVTVTPLHIQAAQLYTRLTGVKIPVTAPIISGVPDPRVPQNVVKGMVQYLQENQPMQAALLATNEDSFYNTTVRDFAKRMSTRDESVNTPLNDFVATIVGVAANEKDARQLLTGNFYYSGDPLKTALPSSLRQDILLSNNHYEALETLGYNLRQVLKRVDTQKIFTGTSIVDHPDPAGILTSRAFMSAHAVAGTNRRLVEYAFREFMCIPIAGWSDTSGPDNFIGRDVDRFPGGEHTKFLTTCRGCHSNMDGLRGAFARFNFADNFVKYGPLMPVVTDPDTETATNMCQNPTGVACKMNRNNDSFPDGYVTNDDSWVNNANRNSNATYFGWGQNTSGRGLRSLASEMASSTAFPKCMAKRAFRAVCKREPVLLDSSLIDSASTQFIAEGYDLERLFARIAIARECIGDNLGQ